MHMILKNMVLNSSTTCPSYIVDNDLQYMKFPNATHFFDMVVLWDPPFIICNSLKYIRMPWNINIYLLCSLTLITIYNNFYIFFVCLFSLAYNIFQNLMW